MSTHGEIIYDPTEDSAKQPSTIRYILSIVVAAALIAVFLRVLIMDVFYVPSGSMEPTIDTGDRVLSTKALLDLTPMGNIDNGDIIIFADDNNWTSGQNPIMVKRVIGTSGDTVQGLEDGTIIVNGEKLPEPYAQEATQRPFEVTVPEGEYWVMGDNRGNSADSRTYLNSTKNPFISEESTKGVVFFTVPGLPGFVEDYVVGGQGN